KGFDLNKTRRSIQPDCFRLTDAGFQAKHSVPLFECGLSKRLENSSPHSGSPGVVRDEHPPYFGVLFFATGDCAATHSLSVKPCHKECNFGTRKRQDIERVVAF